MSHNNPWTEEETATLKGLIEKGMTYSHISSQLPGRTRSACVGQAYRLGLTNDSQKLRPKVAPHKPVPRVKKPKPDPVVEKVPEPIVCEEVAPEPDPVGGVTLMNLKAHHCRWPIGHPGNPDFVFCGAHKKSPVLAYCPSHDKIAHQPQPKRKFVHMKSGIAMRNSVGRI